MRTLRSLLLWLALGMAGTGWADDIHAPRVASHAHRVASLAPSLTELVYALGFGDRLIARSSACDYPSAALTLPVVGDFGRPNLERLAALRPDVVLVTDMEKPAMLDRIRQMSVHVLVLPCEGWDDLMQAALLVSAALGDPAKGATWVEAMEARKAALAERVSAHMADQTRPRVYVEVWRDPPTTVGPGTFLHELVGLAGGQNIGAGLKRGYAHVSAEWVIREDPDVILLAYAAVSGAGRNEIAQRLGWPGIKAVRENRICADISPDLLTRPGPRLIEGAEAFAEWLLKQAADSHHRKDAKRMP